MTRGSIERRIERLERDADPEVCTWRDLMTAVDEGREITLSPGEAMPEARPGEVLIVDDISRLVGGHFDHPGNYWQ